MKQTVLSVKQAELLENLIVKYGQIVNSDQIYTEAKSQWDYKQAKNLITKLVKNGWLIRIKKSLYAISDLSSRGFLSLSPYIVANFLVKDSYVSFESALAYYGMFDQLTNKVISVSLKAYQTVNLGNIEYSFVKTKEKFYLGWREIEIDNKCVRIATAEKALIDIVNFHRSKYSIDLVIEKLQKNQNNLSLAKFNKYLKNMSSTATKIFGLIFDLLGINSDQLYKIVKIRQGTHWMLAGNKKFNAKWRLYYDEYFDKYQV